MKNTALHFCSTVLLLLSLSGCGGGGGGDGSAPVPLTRAGDILVRQLEGHDYGVYTPAHLDDPHPPLLLVLHGAYTSTTAQTDFVDEADRLWGARKMADENGYVLVFPRSRHNAPDTPPGWWWAFGRDETFLAHLIDQLAQDYAIDRQRVFALGHSNGGGLLHNWMCLSAGSGVTAMVSLSGSLFNLQTYKHYLDPSYACHPDYPQSHLKAGIMHIHSVADSIVPYQGDSQSESVAAMMSIWSGNLSCSGAVTSSNVPGLATEAGTSSTLQQWQGCGGPLQSLIMDPGHHIPAWDNELLHPVLKRFFDDAVSARLQPS